MEFSTVISGLGGFLRGLVVAVAVVVVAVLIPAGEVADAVALLGSKV